MPGTRLSRNVSLPSSVEERNHLADDTDFISVYEGGVAGLLLRTLAPVWVVGELTSQGLIAELVPLNAAYRKNEQLAPETPLLSNRKGPMEVFWSTQQLPLLLRTLRRNPGCSACCSDCSTLRSMQLENLYHAHSPL